MFSNIGRKIKILAMVLCGIGVFISIVYGVYLIVSYFTDERLGSPVLIAGLIILVIGSLLSWVGSFVLYGFGQLVENSDRMASNMEKSLALQQSYKDDISLIKESLSSKKDDT